MKPNWVITSDGTHKCYVGNVLESVEDQPAEIWKNGTSVWRKNGKLHRDNGLPAMIGHAGTEKYAVNGKYHRLGDLPAITWSKGPYRQEWWINGEIKRAIRKDGTEEFFMKGSVNRDSALLHRDDGPARIHPNGHKEYWLQGHQYETRTHWLRALDVMNKENLNNQHLSDEDTTDMIDEDPAEDIADEEEKEEVQHKSSKQVKQGLKMKNSSSVSDMLKSNAISAGYRMAGTQATSLVKQSLISVMRNKGVDGGQLDSFAKFLDTEFGSAIISGILGMGLHYVPHFNEDPRVQRLAEEMRVNGMAIAGNAVIGEVMQHLLPAVSDILQKLPALDEKNTVRVEDKTLVSAMEEESEEDSEKTSTTATPKVMKA